MTDSVKVKDPVKSINGKKICDTLHMPVPMIVSKKTNRENKTSLERRVPIHEHQK